MVNIIFHKKSECLFAGSSRTKGRRKQNSKTSPRFLVSSSRTGCCCSLSCLFSEASDRNCEKGIPRFRQFALGQPMAGVLRVG
ncbi:hypothetical protein JTE90_027339 [Oedothorax gibbosus]|uniref:Uncharacterized protein n=1 Tax=Oedothorax gibbosus TaxID=931172 RepID=A0AAV6VZ40_9ARAC|nr:hypothetical protein JTE90_027339 [Oedothorax gibbosus]